MPNAVAWRADGWLIQDVVGGERLALGDEFGCHGMPGKNIEDDLSVVQECKDYLTSQINASKWGEQPLSFGIPMETLDALTLNIMEEAVSESSAIMWNQISVEVYGALSEMPVA